MFFGEQGGTVAADAPRGAGRWELPGFEVGGAAEFADVGVGDLDDEAEVGGGDVVEREVGGAAGLEPWQLPSAGPPWRIRGHRAALLAEKHALRPDVRFLPPTPSTM